MEFGIQVEGRRGSQGSLVLGSPQVEELPFAMSNRPVGIRNSEFGTGRKFDGA